MRELNGTTQSLRVGNSFTFALSEGAATPYLWAIESISNPDLVEVNMHYTPAQGDSIGAAGHKVITVTAMNKGTASVYLKHWDQWQNHVQETFEISFNID